MSADPPTPAPAELPLVAPPSEPSPPSDGDAVATPQPFRWKTNLALFLATVLSVFLAGTAYVGKLPDHGGVVAVLRALPSGWEYAVPLLAILLCHEFGHYFAARHHRVDASLPYFIPFPLISPFGTMGAVIAMRGRIKSRNALLDIGASGPLAGLVVAIPVLVVGLLRSEVMPLVSPSMQEGQSLLYLALKRVLLGPIPAGHDVFIGPLAFAGWTGIFVTMLNLLPVGQLDGGHIAYALFERRQHRYARLFHRALLLVFGFNLVRFVGPVARSGAWDGLGQAGSNSLFWLFWWGILHVLARVGGRDHPPTEPGQLSPGRKGLAVLSLVFFALLFMPTPWAAY